MLWEMCRTRLRCLTAGCGGSWWRWRTTAVSSSCGTARRGAASSRSPSPQIGAWQPSSRLRRASRLSWTRPLPVSSCRTSDERLTLSMWSVPFVSVPNQFMVQHRSTSPSSSSLIDRRTRLSTVGDRAFPVTAAFPSPSPLRVWNELPHYITPAPSPRVFWQLSEDSSFSRSFLDLLWYLWMTCVIMGC